MKDSPDDVRDRREAFAFQGQGRLGEAEALYRRILARSPADFEAWNNLGNIHRSRGEAASAVSALERAAALRPDQAMIRLNLAGALAEAGRFDDSLAAVREAMRLAPDEPACHVELSRAHARLGDDEGALTALDPILRRFPGHPLLLVERGLLHASLGQFGEAEKAYRGAIETDPRTAAAWFYLGILFEHTNRPDELADLLSEAAAQRVPPGPLALVRAYSLRREGKLREALEVVKDSPLEVEPQRRAQLVGELSDRTGDSDAAFAAFAEMNRFAAAAAPEALAAAAGYRQEVRALLDLVTPVWLSAWTPVTASDDRSPVFLIGFPRSGTTLLDTALMGHSQVHVIEEKPTLQPLLDALGGMERLADLDDRGAAELRDLYFATVERLEGSVGGRRLVDKMPLNITRLPLIHRLFPDARIVVCLRHPCDVVLSTFITAFRLNPAMANFLRLDDAAELYDLVMSLWLRCRDGMQLDVHVVRYEAMVEDLEASLRALVDWLELGWEPALLDHRRTGAGRGYVASASYAQVTEPIYGRARGRWHRYRRHLQGVLPVLEPWAERLGYEG